MDIDILFWMLIASLPIISGFLEKRRKKQQASVSAADGHQTAERGAAKRGAADRAHPETSGRDPELGSALEEIRRVLSGEYREAEYSAAEMDRPHWEQPAQQKGPAPLIPADSPLLTSSENLMHLPMPVASENSEVEDALSARGGREHVATTPKEIRHAIILADVLGTPRFKTRHRPF